MKIKRSTEFINETLGINRENVKEVSKPNFWSDAIQQARDGYTWFVKRLKEGFGAFNEDGTQIMAAIPETLLAYSNSKRSENAVVIASDDVLKNTKLPNGSLNSIYANIKPTFKYEGGGSFNERLNNVISGELVMEGLRQAELRKLNKVNESATELASNNGIENVHTEEFKNIILDALNNPLDMIPMIYGAPGIGKTTIVENVIKKAFGRIIGGSNFKAKGGTNLVALQLENMDVSDFNLPAYDEIKDEEGNVTAKRAIRCPFGLIPAYRVMGDKPDRDEYDSNEDYIEALKNSSDAKADFALGRGIIFLDEVNRCNSDVEQIAKNLVMRKFTEGWAVGSRWAIICAGNRESDVTNGAVHAFDETFQSRLHPIVNYVPTYKEWRQWAEQYAYMNPVLLDWIRDNQEGKGFYYNRSTDMQAGKDKTAFMTTPRDWEHCCYLLAIAAKNAHDEGHRMSDVSDDEFIEFAVNTDKEMRKQKLGKWDISQFSAEELKHEMMKSNLDRETISDFIIYFKMIQTVDLPRFKNEVWTKGANAVKIESLYRTEGSGSDERKVKVNADTAVITTIYKIAIDAKSSQTKEPKISEIKSLFDSLTNYNESIAMNIMRIFFDTFPKLGEMIQDYTEYVGHTESANDASLSEVERKGHASSARAIASKLHLYDERTVKYFDELDHTVDYLAEKFPRVMKMFDFDE